MAIFDQLKHLGCSLSEVTIFQVLANNPQGLSVVQIAQIVDQPRPTIYTQLDSLIKRGLALRGVGEQGSIFYPQEPRRIERIFEEQIQLLQETKEGLAKSLTTTNRGSVPVRPRVLVYQKGDVLGHMLRDMAYSGEDEILWFWSNIPVESESIDRSLELFYKDVRDSGIGLRTLISAERMEAVGDRFRVLTQKKEDRIADVRLLPREIVSHAGYGIYGSRVAFISGSLGGYASIITNTELAESLRAQFNYFWKIGKKVPKKK